jgi:ribose 5-phosphate isomerase A
MNKTSATGSPTAPGILAAAERAAEEVRDGSCVGLGSGRAASAFITALGTRIRRGLRITAVPTSEASAQLARSLGIELVEIDEDMPLAVVVDGADEVAPNLDLVKGRGNAFVRERIVTAASRQQVIIVDPSKLVPVLCGRNDGGFPVEVIPLAKGLAMRRLKALGLRPVIRWGGRARDGRGRAAHRGGGRHGPVPGHRDRGAGRPPRRTRRHASPRGGLTCRAPCSCSTSTTR